jgi:hypothetical protein
MSYDITTEPDSGLDWNYTYNVQPMTAAAGLHSLTRLDGMKARDAAGVLDSVLRNFDGDPETYRALNPKNGWGDFDGFRLRLGDLYAHLLKVPDAVVRVG